MGMSNINISSQSCTKLTPKNLLNEVKNGKKPEYTHEENADRLQKELNALAQSYRASVNINNKTKLLKKEREMLYEELEHPELTLARNYEDIKKLLPEDVKGNDVEDILRLFNINGIQRSEVLAGDDAFKQKNPERYVDVLENAFLKTSEKTYIGQQVKNTILSVLSWVNYSSDYEYDEKINKTYEKFYKNTKDEDLKNSIKDYMNWCSDGESFDKTECIKNLNKQMDNSALEELISNTKAKDTETTQLINKILKSKDVGKEVLNTAIWGAGKHRNDENFEIVKNIATDKNETDIRKREFAIQSTALYIKDKPEEVKSILESISKENSAFSPLGKILSDKVNGKYFANTDKALKDAGISDKEIQKFKKNLNKFFKKGNGIKLNNQKEGMIQVAAAPFSKQITRFLKGGKHYHIIKDTFTELAPEDAGKRDFTNGLTNSGFYDDALVGAANEEFCAAGVKEIQHSDGYKVVTHEMGHLLHFSFDKEDMAKIDKLFEKAKKHDKALDYYAANNSMEYFAQGVEAYNSPYKPHKYLKEDTTNTRYELMVRDPELYKFVEKVLQKYK